MINKLQKRINEVQTLKSKKKKNSVLVIQQFPKETSINVNFPSLRESVIHIIAFMEISCEDTLRLMYPIFKEKFDYILFDNDIKIKKSVSLIKFSEKNMAHENIFYYSDINIWADSAISLLSQIINGVHNKNLLINGNGILHKQITSKIKICNDLDFNKKSKADAIIGTNLMDYSTDIDYIKYVDPKTKIYDVGIGNFTKEFIYEAKKIGAEVFRIDIRAGISSAIINILETNYLIDNIMGQVEIKNVNIVAGGILGKSDSVVVDNITKPCFVLGVTDGTGRFKDKLSVENKKDIKFVQKIIREKQ